MDIELSRRFIKTSLVYLMLGSLLGGSLLANKALTFDPRLPGLLPVHIQWVFMGWTLQLAMGVCLWIMPRIGPSGRSYGKTWPAAVSYVLLNMGILLSSVGFVLQVRQSAPDSGVFFVTAAAAEVSGILFFVYYISRRLGIHFLERSAHRQNHGIKPT